MSKNKKKPMVKGLPPPIRPSAETMEAFWADVFQRYAEEIKPFQGAFMGGLAKGRRHAAR